MIKEFYFEDLIALKKLNLSQNYFAKEENLIGIDSLVDLQFLDLSFNLFSDYREIIKIISNLPKLFSIHIFVCFFSSFYFI